ncbi:MAG: ArsA family ATPase [Bdellovibrionales bacterium]|nr:ArsA family ATPase [Bdellovibrionales bacterium]
MKKSSLEEIIEKHKILICVGSGGVGKTTLSAALGVRAAQLGKKVLVMTIDPSKRLKIALGVGDEQSQGVKISKQRYAGELHVAILDAQTIFDEFITSAAGDSEEAKALLNNMLYQQLSTTLSGSQEFTSLLQLSKISTQDEYDLLVLDTPPAQHAVDFLEAPGKIGALFEEQIVRWFVGSDQVGFIRKVISAGTKTVFSLLEKITGSRFIHELNGFFRSIRSIQNKISEKTSLVQKILLDSSTGFLLVTGFDEAKLREAEQLNLYLEDKRYHMLGVVINRAFPKWFLNKISPQEPKVAEEYNKWVNYQQQREGIFKSFSSKWRKDIPVARVPDFNADVYGLDGIEVVANELDCAFITNHTNELRAEEQKS